MQKTIVRIDEQKMLEHFADPRLDLNRSHDDETTRDVTGNVSRSLLKMFAVGAGKKAGTFYTSEGLILLAKLARPRSGDRICDSVCGPGSLLIQGAEVDTPSKRRRSA